MTADAVFPSVFVSLLGFLFLWLILGIAPNPQEETIETTNAIHLKTYYPDMNSRALSLDILRALAIIGMIVSGNIAWNPELSPWFFHAQTPPPDFSFNPTIPGITWVDLVFPFFLFSLGAALPFALGRRLDGGESRRSVLLSALQRGVLLAFFAILLGNSKIWNLAEVVSSVPLRVAMTLGVWGGFFLLFIRLKSLSSRANRLLNLGGAALCVGMMFLYEACGVGFSIYRSDIIILVLAAIALTTSVIWVLTRRNLPLRIVLFLLLAMLKIGAAFPDTWQADVWNFSPATWLFKFRYLEYLLIALPGTVAGELLLEWRARTQNPDEAKPDARLWPVAVLGVAVVLVNLLLLFYRELTWNISLTLLLGASMLALLSRAGMEKDAPVRRLLLLGLLLVLLGLCVEPLQGGIKKDHATLSFHWVTSGMAALMLVFLEMCVRQFRIRRGLLCACGQNPMIAYTAASYVVLPVLSLFIPWLWGGYSVTGAVVRGFSIALLAMLFTSLFTRRKLFWRT